MYPSRSTFSYVVCIVLLFSGVEIFTEAKFSNKKASKNGSFGASCQSGGQQSVITKETELNSDNYWEAAYGRSGASWPRLGFPECWENRGTVCALPAEDHVVCLPGSRRGSAVNNGWALDPRSQPCRPGVFCLYACEPGYYWTQYNPSEASSFDSGHSGNKGHCDGTWDYGTSTQGVYCDDDGRIQKPIPGPMCQLGETYVFAENRLDTHIFICQTVFPGHELFMIPTLIKPGESVMLTTQPRSFWRGPSSSRVTHADFFVSFAGADIMESCTPDEYSPSGAALLPFEIGTGVEDNGVVYSTHYFYQQPNSEIPVNRIGYELDLECTSDEEGVCGDIVYSGGIVKVDVLSKPTRKTSRVSFIFRVPSKKSAAASLYKEPSVQPAAIPSAPYSVTKKGFGRRLKSLEAISGPVYIENRLHEAIVLCREDQKGGGISIGGQERVRIPTGMTYHVTHASPNACVSPTRHPWKLWTGLETETGQAHGFSLDHSHPEAYDLPDFSLSVKCISNEDRCRSVDAKKVVIEGGVSDKGSVEVIFVIKPFSLSSAKRESFTWATSMYEWLLPKKIAN